MGESPTPQSSGTTEIQNVIISLNEVAEDIKRQGTKASIEPFLAVLYEKLPPYRDKIPKMTTSTIAWELADCLIYMNSFIFVAVGTEILSQFIDILYCLNAEIVKRANEDQWQGWQSQST